MQLSFVQKLLVLTMLPLLIAQFGTLFGVMTTAQNEVRETAIKELQVAATVTEQYLVSRASRLQQAAQVLSADYALKEVFSFGDPASVRSALINHGSRIEADFTAFVDLDADEQLAVVSDQAIEAGFNAYVNDQAGASDAMPAASIVFVDSQFYQIFSAPVRAPTTIGYLVFGIHIGDEFATSLAELTGKDVAVVPNASSPGALGIANAQDKKVSNWVDGFTQTGSVYSNFESQNEYLAIATALMDADGSVLLVLRKSIAEAFEPYARAKDSILGVGLLILTVVALLGTGLARGIAHPIKQLTAAASKIAEGSYDTEIKSSSQDEIGRLAAALQTMQTAISERENKILHQTLHDNLTGLPNGEQLNAAIGQSLRIPRVEFSLVCLQLSDLQRIFSLIGQHAAEEFMLGLCGLLRERLPASSVLYRTGTHEFFVLLPECAVEQTASLMASVAEDLRTGVRYQNKSLLLRAHAGIAAFPEHGDQRESLIRRAKIAAVDA